MQGSPDTLEFLPSRPTLRPGWADLSLQVLLSSALTHATPRQHIRTFDECLDWAGLD